MVAARGQPDGLADGLLGLLLAQAAAGGGFPGDRAALVNHLCPEVGTALHRDLVRRGRLAAASSGQPGDQQAAGQAARLGSWPPPPPARPRRPWRCGRAAAQRRARSLGLGLTQPGCRDNSGAMGHPSRSGAGNDLDLWTYAQVSGCRDGHRRGRPPRPGRAHGGAVPTWAEGPRYRASRTYPPGCSWPPGFVVHVKPGAIGQVLVRFPRIGGRGGVVLVTAATAAPVRARPNGPVRACAVPGRRRAGLRAVHGGLQPEFPGPGAAGLRYGVTSPPRRRGPIGGLVNTVTPAGPGAWGTAPGPGRVRAGTACCRRNAR